MKQSSLPAPRHCERSEAIQSPSSRHCERSEAIQPPLLPSLRAKRGNPVPSPPVIASEVKQSSLPSPRHCERSEAIQSPSSRHCERSEAIQPPLLPSLRAKRGNPVPSPPVIASEAWQSSTPGIKSGGPFYPSDHPEHRIWGSVLPFRPPRASNLGVCFTLPTTPGIESEGHFHLPDSSEVKFGGHSCIIDLPDTLIWGSFFYHRPVRHPNLGVILAPSTCPTP